jgi:hypothetical protein
VPQKREQQHGLPTDPADPLPGSVGDLGDRVAAAVAILTTPAFDAVTVDPLSVALGPAGAHEAHGRGHTDDVDADGDLDLVLHSRTQETGCDTVTTEYSLVVSR